MFPLKILVLEKQDENKSEKKTLCKSYVNMFVFKWYK